MEQWVVTAGRARGERGSFYRRFIGEEDVRGIELTQSATGEVDRVHRR